MQLHPGLADRFGRPANREEVEGGIQGDILAD